jgi:quinohemoprotein amine dehydrogenase
VSPLRILLPSLLILLPSIHAQSVEEGIPVTDPLVIEKCGGCHARDNRGNMLRLSWERATPEGWEEVLKRMIRLEGVNLTPPEARAILKYLGTSHGLAPEEAKPVMFFAERRVQEENDVPSGNLRETCARCHAFARALSWRRSLDDWKQLANLHVALSPQADETLRLGFQAGSPPDLNGPPKPLPGELAVAALARIAPLHTPEWTAWSAQMHPPKLAGRWLVSARLPGRGRYYGEMTIEQGGADDDFATHVTLKSINDGSTIVRSGRSVVYAGYAWRGRSKGEHPASPAPDDLSSDMREVLWISPDAGQAEGRWFWGQYQEFGFDVKLRRASADATLLGVDRSSLKTGSQANRMRLIGDNFPPAASPTDLNFGSGVAVRRIVSSAPNEIIAEVDVAADAVPGKRDAAFGRSIVPGAIAIYDRIDYVKVVPESAMTQFGGATQPQAYQQFDAIGYQRGPDGQPHTPDDVELGPVDVTWSLEEMYALPGASTTAVGQISPTGLFTPATVGRANNHDVWVIAKAANEKDKNGRPLVGKAYMVVSVPTYMFDGRRYVRDLDRWVEEGPGTR